MHFVPHRLIESQAAHIFRALTAKNNLCGFESDAFTEELAKLFVSLNNLHPFRDGNGRLQRFFLEKLASNAGYDLAFDVVTRERMVSVSIAGAMGDVEPAVRLFTEILDVDRIRALRAAIKARRTHYGYDWNDVYIATTVAGQKYRGVLAGVAGSDFMMRVTSDRDWVAIGSVADLPERAESGDEISITATHWK